MPVTDYGSEDARVSKEISMGSLLHAGCSVWR
jgi:hypothetical protein